MNTRSDCPISFSLDIIGDKWTLLILRDLIFSNKSSFSDLLKSDEKIATNILTDRLTKLENEDLITKNVSSENKSKFVYTITEKSFFLLPVLIELYIWGVKTGAKKVDSQFYDEMTKNKAKFLNKLKKDLVVKIANVA